MEVNGLISTENTDMVMSAASVPGEAVTGGENKINNEDNDDIQMALDALRNCDTDFIRFDDV